MKVLAFDTSSKALSLAILEDKQVLAETTINIKKNHSITLMPAIDFLMGEFGLDSQGLGQNRGGRGTQVAIQACELRWRLPNSGSYSEH